MRAQCIRTSYDGLAVPVIAEVLACLVQREDHAGQTVVEGRVSSVCTCAVDQPVRRATGQTRGLHATRQLIRLTHETMLSTNGASPQPDEPCLVAGCR